MGPYTRRVLYPSRAAVAAGAGASCSTRETSLTNIKSRAQARHLDTGDLLFRSTLAYIPLLVRKVIQIQYLDHSLFLPESRVHYTNT